MENFFLFATLVLYGVAMAWLCLSGILVVNMIVLLAIKHINPFISNEKLNNIGNNIGMKMFYVFIPIFPVLLFWGQSINSLLLIKIVTLYFGFVIGIRIAHMFTVVGRSKST